MLTMALDTTTRSGSVAVLRDDALLSVVRGDAARTHGERLPGEIDEALRRAHVARASVELLVVASGPGAFTGLRIGLAAVQGIAMVLGTPTIGVSALDALAVAARAIADAADRTVATWMDAQRGEVFAALYAPTRDIDDRRDADAPVVVDPGSALDVIQSRDSGEVVLIGDGAARYRDLIEQRLGDRARVLDAPEALAPFLGQIGRRRAAQGHAGPPHALQPLYVRRPDAELERARRS